MAPRALGSSRAPDLRYGDALGRDDTIVAYEVDGCELATGPDGLPVPTHADGAPENLEVLATAPARLWKQDEQPSRYAHEPGELENTAMAVFGPGWRDQVHESRTTTPCSAVFTKPGGGTVFNAGVTDWAYGLESGDPDVVADHPQRDRTPDRLSLSQLFAAERTRAAPASPPRR